MTQIGRFVGLAVGVAALATLLSVLGIALGAQQSAAVAIVLRSVGALTALVSLLMWAVARWRSSSSRAFLAAVLGAYLLMPLAPAGRALLTQLVFESWAVGLVLDALVWLGVGWAVVRLQVGRHPRLAEEVEAGVAGLR